MPTRGYCWCECLVTLLSLLCVALHRDNPFARAVAQGQVEKNAPILQAVAYDLDTLQVRKLQTWGGGPSMSGVHGARGPLGGGGGAEEPIPCVRAPGGQRG
jgi:hypothetical protein